MADEHETTTEAAPTVTPLVEGEPEQVAERVYVIPDRRINLVPNVGFVLGDDAVLVIDPGMGPQNGARVRESARRLAGGRDLVLTVTHFHPEHGFAAQAFKGDATIVYNGAQADELRQKGPAFIDMFKGFGPHIAELLEDVRLVEPDDTYAGERELDLGGVRVVLREEPAHTRGDQVAWLPEERVLFGGDLVENRFFPILPDEDAKGGRWIDVLGRLERLSPATVVPGHGEIGGGELLRDAREYLELVRDEVVRLAGDGRSLDDLEAELQPRIADRYRSWDNAMWIPFAIRVFHAEVTGEPLRLPSF